ncbi:TIGR03364 family FAD-dependent oxidoreductase [Actinoalloteichus hymeniacidonis]|uniref:FAD dependent oxidoreductase TIGR03364 n=1 Tax=Actinoalloteichus hymeniacidonis TaxID=340345 RepID=A0AAC9MXM7_9PSEU|nr:TIGR03364 family FAD-dependent oxidoreductase [Actinoalloteichus hymeniacidonis]AOS62072.1 FAD dependent oxidoreductase TIGR03364 [Actinoalloteichus hymeniacidonis]MBB5909906.1 FAD dependent oxidoreductase TIGR03364 [Actinoalloteichus hymeniacidonis]
MTSHSGLLDSVDLVVVGAGIVGLAHAYAAVERGLSVAVVERDERAVGASVRNFGHGCVTGQDGLALDYALAARHSWLRLATEAGFWLREAGTVVVARAEDEYRVLAEFAGLRDGQVQLLDAAGVRERVSTGPDVVGGALLPLDLRVDPREAVHAVARYLAERGVRFYFSTSAALIEPGEVVTSRGRVRAAHVVLAVGHDVDRFFPTLAEDHGLRRCALHMLRVADPHGREVSSAVLTGLSMLRYGGFAVCPSLTEVRDRITRESPRLLELGLNLMFTQLPGGDLTIGDTHSYARTHAPYQAEDLDECVLAEIAQLLGVPTLTVRERWRGIYASAPEPFLVAAPAPGVRVASVTTGIGMTTAFGFAPAVLDDLLG